jgi:ribose 5-phosphate isomerase A
VTAGGAGVAPGGAGVAPGGAGVATGVEADKRAAAEAAAELVEDGMKIGLGTGSTVAYLLPALARRGLDICCIATSRATQAQASELGLHVAPFEGLDRLDIAIDGADQVTPGGWLVKGGGGAQVREKVVAAAAGRFVVIVSGDKLVERVHAPIPLEILAFGADATLGALGDARLRAGAPASPDGGIIADWYGEIGDPAAVSAWLDSVPGVVGHGLFPPALVHDVVVAAGGQVEHRRL